MNSQPEFQIFDGIQGGCQQKSFVQFISCCFLGCHFSYDFHLMPAKIDRSCLPRDSGVYYYLSTLDNDTSGIEVHYFQFYTTAQCSRKPLFFPVPVLTNFWPPRIFFVKTQRIRNKPSNFTNFLLYNQMILHKRGNEKVQKNIILSMFEQKFFNLPC